MTICFPEKTTTGAVVNPGSVRVYHFDVTLDDGPTKYDTNCLTNMYHSAVDLSKDIYSGLFGPLIVCRHGTLKHDGKQVRILRQIFKNHQFTTVRNLHVTEYSAS